jgi:hypothetical protein
MNREVLWFQKSVDRVTAERIISQNISLQSSSGLVPEQVIIIRYSSDPKIHFVITTKSPVSSTIEHFTVVNSALGYSISGKDTEKFPNLLALCQNQIIDKLFVPVIGTSIRLSTESCDQWSAIFQDAIKEFAVGHYKSVEDLNEQCANLRTDEIQNNINFSFQAAFMPAVTSNVVRVAGALSSSSASPPELSVVGKYMVNHGLDLLLQSGANEVKLNAIKRLLEDL